MTASWDSFRAGPPRRIRGGEAALPAPNPIPWRHQRRVQAEALAAARKAANDREPLQDVQPRAGVSLGRLHIDLDGVFAFALFMPMLFAGNIGSLSAAAIAGLVPLYLFARRKQLQRVLLPRAFLFIVPAFALLSVLWSQAPKETLKYAVEFGLTVIAGLLLSSARSQEAVLRGLALAFFIYVGDSLLAGGTVAVGVGAGGTAFSGLTDSKNLLADITSTGLLISMATAFMALRSRSWLWLAFAALAVLMDFYVVLAARSAGALLGLCMGLAPLLFLTPVMAAGKAVRAWLTSTLAVVLLAGALNFRWIAELMIQLGASLFDKDPTLTGRTYLWYRAADLIREHPGFGVGYYAFWLQGNIDAEGLWRYAGIASRMGFTFHNTLVEILVTMGWMGAALILACVAVGAVALIRKFVTRPSLALVFWISLLLYELARTPIETVGIAPFYFSTALVFAALSAGFGRVRPPRAVQRLWRRQPQNVHVLPVNYAGQAWANPRLAPVRGTLRVLHNPRPERP